MDCYQIVQLIISGLVLSATAILAFTAWKSTKSAEKSAQAASKAVESNNKNTKQQAILHILDDYSSVEMRGYLHTLWWWFNNKEAEIIQMYKDARETNNFDKVNKGTEDARRYVALHCTKIYSLYKAGILSDKEIKDYELVNKELSILFGKLEELDEPERGKNVYEFYRNLFKY